LQAVHSPVRESEGHHVLKALSRVGFACLFVLSTAASADAALISISEFSTGGGTLVHDGSGDVSSTDGSAVGNALLMSSFGLTNNNLANDLSLFTITGLLEDNDNNVSTADLTALWLIGTIDGNPLPSCPTCGTLNDVNVGSTLGLDPILGNTQNVLFAIGIVGSPGANPWVGPGNLASPQVVPVDQFPLIAPSGPTFTYGLTAAQIAFIVARMTQLGFDVNDIRLGLSASANPFGENVRSTFDLQGPAAVPEPGTLLLLGSGIAAAGLRRVRRRRATH
jgi:hypothetical protein